MRVRKHTLLDNGTRADLGMATCFSVYRYLAQLLVEHMHPDQKNNGGINTSIHSAEGFQMPLGVWFFLRLFVPVGPIIIQYALYGLGVYAPAFPQLTYITLLFTLSLVTLTEYKDIQGIIYGSVAPALAATFLYTVALLVQNNPTAYNNTLLLGFAVWLMLVVYNVIRVLLNWRRERSKRGKTK